MTFKGTLTGIVVAGALALGVSGCGNYDTSKYNYTGTINGEEVTFKDIKYVFDPDVNILTVKKQDGRIITYIDNEFYNELQLKLNQVVIKKDGKEIIYSNYASIHPHSDVEKIVLEEAQKQFDNYLKQILETKERDKQTKLKEGLDSLK